MDLKLKNNKHTLSFCLGDDILLTINKSVLNELLNPPKQAKPKNNLENKTQLLVKAYMSAWENFYGVKCRAQYKQGTKDWSHFTKAAELCVAHNVKTSVFMASQVAGLKFVNGKGIFPKPNQLSSPQAETRLMDYIKDASIDGPPPELSWEKNVPLEQNATYSRFRQLIRDGSASLKEARYVAACQLARRGSVEVAVKAYIKVMEEHAQAN